MTEQPVTDQPEMIQPSPAQKQSNTLALLSLIAGIISIVALLINFCVPCVGVPGVLFGIAGAVMGFISKKQIDESNGQQTGRKMAMAGIITSLIGAGVSLLWSLLRFVLGLLGIGTGLMENLFNTIFF